MSKIEELLKELAVDVAATGADFIGIKHEVLSRKRIAYIAEGLRDKYPEVDFFIVRNDVFLYEKPVYIKSWTYEYEFYGYYGELMYKSIVSCAKTLDAKLKDAKGKTLVKVDECKRAIKKKSTGLIINKYRHLEFKISYGNRFVAKLSRIKTDDNKLLNLEIKSNRGYFYIREDAKNKAQIYNQNNEAIAVIDFSKRHGIITFTNSLEPAIVAAIVLVYSLCHVPRWRRGVIDTRPRFTDSAGV